MKVTNQKINVVCFGEVLFDVFPTHKKIGGAPLNVAIRLASLGIKSQIISRIGDDEIGKELLQYIKDHKVNSNSIQIDKGLKTGKSLCTLKIKVWLRTT